ncbi:MAG TPA: hypothetical protein VEK07_12655 [Polyangiaceae bacterium]|nr:hypothetical protein [Polyangiaceae bacterium]
MSDRQGLRRRSIFPGRVLPWAAVSLGAVMACALGARAGEARRTIDVGRVLDAGVALDIRVTATPPDPTPLVAQTQWVFDLRWDRGDVWLLGVRKISLPASQPTPRVMGRFALELFEGPTLIERVRFDFPLMAVPDSSDGGLSRAPSFTDKLRTRIGVVFPATPRGTRLELVDRATGRRWPVPWPVASATDDRGQSAGTP